MKAVLCSVYGSPDVLEPGDVLRPSPKADAVLIKVYAASVNTGDWRLMRADPPFVRLTEGLFKPKAILGSDVAGRVEAVGERVTQF